MKKFLLPLLLFSGVVFAQGFAVPHYTTSLKHAPNCFIDSSITLSNNSLSSRITYSYDANFKLLKKYRRDVVMNQSEADTYTYDANDSVVVFTHASGTSAPTQTMMTRKTRNLAKRVEFDTVLYNSGSLYAPNAANSYSYDASGNTAEITRHSYSSSWAPLNRTQYTRNGAGKITLALFQGWISNAWQNMNQNTITYNSNGDATDQVFQSWNSSGSVWQNQSRTHYAYTGTHLDTMTTYQWNTAWTNGSKYTHTPAGSLDTVTVETWTGTQWDKFTRYARTWSQGLMTSIIEQDYTNKWESAWKYDYSYDGQGNHIKTDISAYTGGSNPWFVLMTTDHDYSCYAIIAGLDKNIMPQSRVYPVPSSGMLYIESPVPVKSGVVMNINGQEIKHFDGSSVDLSSVEAGVYFVKVSYLDGSGATLKAVKE